MATTYNNAQIGVVDASGNLNVIYPITKATNVAYKSTNVDAKLTSLQSAVDTLNSKLDGDVIIPKVLPKLLLALGTEVQASSIELYGPYNISILEQVLLTSICFAKLNAILFCYINCY